MKTSYCSFSILALLFSVCTTKLMGQAASNPVLSSLEIQPAGSGAVRAPVSTAIFDSYFESECGLINSQSHQELLDAQAYANANCVTVTTCLPWCDGVAIAYVLYAIVPSGRCPSGYGTGLLEVVPSGQ